MFLNKRENDGKSVAHHQAFGHRSRLPAVKGCWKTGKKKPRTSKGLISRTEVTISNFPRIFRARQCRHA
jgi:hypothetical protein